MSNTEEYDRKQQPPYLDPALVINTRLNEVERQQREDNAGQKKHARSQRTTNWLSTIFTGLLFVTSCISDFVLLRQTSITRESANAAKSAAETASSNLAQSRADSISQDKRNREAVEASAKQSKAALDASIEISRNDQRAWIGANGFRIVVLRENQPLVAQITLTNSGKTPALNMRTWGRIQTTYSAYSGSQIADLMMIEKAKPAKLTPAIFPNPTVSDPYFLPFTTVQALTPVYLRDIQAGRLLVYLFGDLVYDDAFGKKHLPQFCGRYAPASSRFDICNEYGHAD